MNLSRRFLVALCLVATPLLLVAALLVGMPSAPTEASSHREAPGISKDAFADGADTYAWMSPNDPTRVVLAATWIPFEGPEGGPNYWEFDPGVIYKIYVSNDGDADPEITYSLTATSTLGNPNTFLYNTGPIDSLADPDWNLRQSYTLVEDIGGTLTTLVDNQLAPPHNLGDKSIPNYAALEAEATYTHAGSGIQVFAGSTDDPFWVDLQVFDLLTLRGQPAPIGYGELEKPVDSLSGFNVHSLIIEVPVARVTAGGEPVIGVWATAERSDGMGGWTQVSRLGMPLVNEVVIPLGLKDTFNAIPPSTDLSVYGLLQESVEDPEVGNLLCALYGAPMPEDADDNCVSEYTAGTPASGRSDLFDVFLRGMVLASPFTIVTSDGTTTTLPAGTNVNRPAGAVPSEMIRLNTALAGLGLCSQTPSRLGVLGGDACGFPNGRRPLDDVIEIELLAVAGAAYGVLDGSDAGFSFNPALIGLLDDGLDVNDMGFRSTFPYFAPAQSGRSHIHTNEVTNTTSFSFGNLTINAGSAPWLQVAAALASVGLVGTLEWMRRRQRREV